MIFQIIPLKGGTFPANTTRFGAMAGVCLGAAASVVRESLALEFRGNAAMSAPHIPVLLAESLEALNIRAGRTYLDGTFGAGGYAQAMLARGADVIGVDRDPGAIAAGPAMVEGGRLRLIHGRFAELDAIARRLGVDALDGVALDIGVSSMQLDEADRGFSLRFDAPLDMRMEREGRTAADILLEEDEATLADIFFQLGEERAARRIASRARSSSTGSRTRMSRRCNSRG